MDRKTIYVAKDGVEFHDENECLEYERSLGTIKIMSQDKFLSIVNSDEKTDLPVGTHIHLNNEYCDICCMRETMGIGRCCDRDTCFYALSNYMDGFL